MRARFILLVLFIPGLLWAQTASPGGTVFPRRTTSPGPSGLPSEAALFSEAENHYRAGNFILALEAYSELVKRYPLSDRVPDAQYRRALCQVKLQQYREALALLQEIERRYRSTRYLDYVYFWQGVVLYRLEDYALSTRTLAVFLEQTGDPTLVPQALLYQALAGIALEDYQGASAALTKLYEVHFTSPQGAYGYILLLYATLNLAAYQEVLDLAGLRSPEELPEQWRHHYRLYLAEALWELGDWERAGPLYLDLREAGPSMAATAFRRLFLMAQAAGDLDRMQELIRQAEGRLADYPELLEELWIRVGMESFKQDNLELSRYFLSRVWEADDRREVNPAVPLYLAEVLIKQERVPEATGLLEEYLQAGPAESGAALLRLGDLYLGQEQHQRAAAYYERYLKEFPDSARAGEAGYFLAYTRYRQGELDAALELTDRLLESRPQDRYGKDLLRLKAFLEKRSGRLSQAIGTYRKYQEAYPEDLGARLDYLKTLFLVKDYRTLIRETTLLLKGVPRLAERDPYAWLLAGYLRGLSRIAVKDYRGALASLVDISADRLEAENLELIQPYVLYYRAWAAYRLRDYREARRLLAALLEQFPGHRFLAQALYLAGWCSYSLEEFETAAGYFARLAKLHNPLSDRATLLSGKSLLSLEALEEALQVFEHLLRTYPGSPFADDALFESAGARERLGDPEGAAGRYLELTRRYPDSPLVEESIYRRAEVYRGAGRHPQAKNAYFEYRSRFPRGRLVDASLYWGGLSALEMGEKFEAVLHWERLIEEFSDSPFRPDAMRRTAERYADRGEYRQALNILTAMLGEYPEESAGLGVEERADELRYLLLGLSDREASLSSIIGREGGAATRAGREAMIELSRLYIYEGSGRMDLAYQMLSRVMEKEDRETASQAQYLIGEYHYRRNKVIQAAEEFLKAAFINPEDGDLMAAAIFRAAEMMHLAGKKRDTRELVERLERHFPDSQWTEEGKKLLESGGSR